MLKLIIIYSFLFVVIANCQENDTTDLFDYDKYVPHWLKDKIISMSLDEEHYGLAKVYRYEMNGKYIFHIYRPLSSCVYCELYFKDGSGLNQEETKNFMQNKSDPLLIWENRPAVPIDSLIQNSKKEKKVY